MRHESINTSLEKMQERIDAGETINAHNGAGNGEGFLFTDDGTLIGNMPAKISDIPTRWHFLKDSAHSISDIVNRPLYRGAPKCKQAPMARENYSGKNVNGGRKCRMTTPAGYR